MAFLLSRLSSKVAEVCSRNNQLTFAKDTSELIYISLYFNSVLQYVIYRTSVGVSILSPLCKIGLGSGICSVIWKVLLMED